MPSPQNSAPAGPVQQRDRADVVEEKFAVPVIVAAVASVPAVFLTMLEEPYETTGQIINYVSLAVLTAETVVLFLLSRDRIAWLKEHWWIAAVTAVSVPAVLFAVGPAQLLRLMRFVGALRIIRVGRIIKAGRILRRRAGLTGPLRTGVVIVATLASAAFVAAVLSDPEAQTRVLLEQVAGELGVAAIILAGLILGVATFVVWRARGQDDERE